MKTDPKNTNPIRALSHPEHPETDNNLRNLYEVTVYRTEYQTCTVRVEATSEEEAEDLGDVLACDEGTWKTVDAEQYIGDLKQITKGGTNE